MAGKRKRRSTRDEPPPANDAAELPASARSDLSLRHFLFGWLGLALFALMGLALETMHGLKIDFYLDVRHDTRRLMWTLAHTHGTLFSLANIALAVTIQSLNLPTAKLLQFASVCLILAWITMPAGFFLGGIWLYGGDPGRGIVLAPVGGILFLISAMSVAITVKKIDAQTERD